MAIGYTLYLKEIYGITPEVAGAAAPEVQAIAMKALLVVAGADGLSAQEEEYFLKWQKACGAPEATIVALRAFDYTHADPKQIIGDFTDTIQRLFNADAVPAMARSLLYDAIRIAWVDNEYSDVERNALRQIAELLGIDSRTVAALERQVELEIIVRANRLALIYTGG
jgi:uncharacterized tellurite resistance protein B-like protein